MDLSFAWQPGQEHRCFRRQGAMVRLFGGSIPNRPRSGLFSITPRQVSSQFGGTITSLSILAKISVPGAARYAFIIATGPP